MCKLACDVTPPPRRSLVCVPAENDKPANDVHTYQVICDEIIFFLGLLLLLPSLSISVVEPSRGIYI